MQKFLASLQFQWDRELYDAERDQVGFSFVFVRCFFVFVLCFFCICIVLFCICICISPQEQEFQFQISIFSASAVPHIWYQWGAGPCHSPFQVFINFFLVNYLFIFFINLTWLSFAWLDFMLPYLNSATKLGLWLGTRWCSRCGWGTAMSVPLKRCCIRWFIHICLFVFCFTVCFVACLIWVRDGQWPCLFRGRGCFPVCLSVFSFNTIAMFYLYHALQMIFWTCWFFLVQFLGEGRDQK